MSSTARATILASIRSALASDGRTALEAPQLSSQFDEPALSRPILAEQFSTEARALRASVTVTQNVFTCVAAVDAFFKSFRIGDVAFQSSPLAQIVASKLQGFEVIQAIRSRISKLERVGCSLVEGIALLADTGSVVVVATNYEDRLLPYLPRTCVVVSAVERLYPSLSASSLAKVYEAARSGVRGEAVIITGPSRTADIEKTLVLGAHGPATLAIFLIES